MKELPANQLDPRVKTVWRINDAVWICILFLCCGIAFPIIAIADPNAGWAWMATGIIAAVWVLCLIVWLAVLPPIRYARWRYQLSDDHLDIAKGIIWRKRFIIPFICVHNTDTRQGPIQRAFGLSSVTVSTAADGDWVRFRVSDTGVGIDPAIRPYLFEPFFTTKESGKGTGLGLAIVQQVVESHGGEIAVESQPGKGASFTIHLPAVSEPEPESPPEEE